MPTPRPSRRRRWLFRLAAIALVMLPWLVAELSLQAIGWPATDEQRDPFIGFDAQRPLFVKDATSDRYRIAPERLVYFRPESFPFEKQPDEFRIFVVGGSTVQGRPYATETAFSSWLRLALEQADSSRQWTVINCGGVSYASYRLVPIVNEIFDYQPDLIILCTGNNEFLEQRTYGDYLAQPRWQRQLTGWIRQSALVRAGQRVVTAEASAAVEQLPTEVDARLDYQDAMRHYQRDDAWSQAVADHFADSLQRIGQAAQRADIPIWLVLPLTNLRDCPPFKSQPSSDDQPHAAELSAALSQGWFDRPLHDRIDLLQRIVKQDPRLALAHYWLGRSYDELRDASAAQEAYQRALDEDVCPLRATRPLMAILKSKADLYQWPLLDTPRLFAEECPDGILDKTLLEDHVHPSISGHQLIGRQLFDRLAEQLDLPIGAEVDESIDERFNQHLVDLPAAYFEHAQQRLKTLNLWARGRAIGAKPPK